MTVISKKKAAKIMASIGLSVGVLAGCSAQQPGKVSQKTDYSDYRCNDKKAKNGEVLCTNSRGHSMYVPLAFIGANGNVMNTYTPQAGAVNNATNNGNATKGSTTTSPKGSTGLGSGKGGASS